MYNNQVIGNKEKDNKQTGNKKLAQSATQKGKVPMEKAKYYAPQNSPESTSKPVYSNVSGDNQADKGVKVAEKRAKKIIRKNATYTDGAIARAKIMRGM